MASFADYAGSNNTLTPTEAALVRQQHAQSGGTVENLTDPVLDLEWGRLGSDLRRRPSNYFDYFFTGQDIKVRVADVPDTDPNFGDLPIMEFAFSIEQQKNPVYGFWSYTYDAMMRGTRVVAGSFSIATKHPNFMRDLIATAADNRSKTSSSTALHPRKLTEKDELINRYWGKNLDQAFVQVGKVVFGVHPPFSFVVTYGVQTMSVPQQSGSSSFRDFYAQSYKKRDNEMVQDVNHRLVEADPSFEDRVIIDAVELTNCTRQFTPDGNIVSETYSFIGRDVYSPVS